MYDTWRPVRITADPANWYAMHEPSGLVCGPAGLTREQAQNWCGVKNAGHRDAPVLPGRLRAVVEEADALHIVGG